MPMEEDQTAAITATGSTPEDSIGLGIIFERAVEKASGRRFSAASIMVTPEEKCILCIRVSRNARNGRKEVIRKKALCAADESSRSRVMRSMNQSVCFLIKPHIQSSSFRREISIVCIIALICLEKSGALAKQERNASRFRAGMGAKRIDYLTRFWYNSLIYGSAIKRSEFIGLHVS